MMPIALLLFKFIHLSWIEYFYLRKKSKPPDDAENIEY